ncbi:MAG: alpha/beta hydrolase [Candidatus Nanopelagicales bacterium]
MSVPVEAMLVATDGVRVAGTLTPGPGDTAFVVVHGFTGHGRQDQVRAITARLTGYGSVITVDLRGHGRSGGESTVGMLEVLDVDAAVRWARGLGYRKVITIGFSMGAAVAIRQAALALSASHGSSGDPKVDSPVDAVIAVSGPAFWYYRGTSVMRALHWLVETRTGRLILRSRRTRIHPREWPYPRPIEPVQAAGMLGSTPLLVVHGTADRYFPVEHPKALHEAAVSSGHPDAELWLLEGVGHAESAIALTTIDEMARWGMARCSDSSS